MHTKYFSYLIFVGKDSQRKIFNDKNFSIYSIHVCTLVHRYSAVFSPVCSNLNFVGFFSEGEMVTGVISATPWTMLWSSSCPSCRWPPQPPVFTSSSGWLPRSPSHVTVTWSPGSALPSWSSSLSSSTRKAPLPHSCYKHSEIINFIWHLKREHIGNSYDVHVHVLVLVSPLISIK